MLQFQVCVKVLSQNANSSYQSLLMLNDLEFALINIKMMLFASGVGNLNWGYLALLNVNKYCLKPLEFVHFIDKND